MIFNKVRFLIGILLITIFLNLITVAQTKEDATLKACEETADKLKRLEVENASLKLQIQLRDEKLQVKEEQINNLKEQSKFWEKAAQTGDKIDVNSTLVIQNLRQQVSEYQMETNRLTIENNKLRSSRNFRTLVGFGVGLGVGTFLK